MNQETRNELYDLFDANPGACIEILERAINNVRYNRETLKSFDGDFTPKELRKLVKCLCDLAKIIDG